MFDTYSMNIEADSLGSLVQALATAKVSLQTMRQQVHEWMKFSQLTLVAFDIQTSEEKGKFCVIYYDTNSVICRRTFSIPDQYLEVHPASQW